MEHDPKPAARNIVILCDGTGNEISENISNVLKLYRCLRNADAQHSVARGIGRCPPQKMKSPRSRCR